MNTERVMIDLSGIELEQIDRLVEQRFYSKRSDFIRTAIRSQLEKHSNNIESALNSLIPQLTQSLDSIDSETSIITNTGIIKLRRID